MMMRSYLKPTPLTGTYPTCWGIARLPNQFPTLKILSQKSLQLGKGHANAGGENQVVVLCAGRRVGSVSITEGRIQRQEFAHGRGCNQVEVDAILAEIRHIREEAKALMEVAPFFPDLVIFVADHEFGRTAIKGRVVLLIERSAAQYIQIGRIRFDGVPAEAKARVDLKLQLLELVARKVNLPPNVELGV